jgi:hypothetical protein
MKLLFCYQQSNVYCFVSFVQSMALLNVSVIATK